MSLFDLKTNVDELSSANVGISKKTFEQIPPIRNIAGTAFSDGAINIRFQCNGQKWWVPSSTYLRFRCKLTKPPVGLNAPLPLQLSDNIAPNMGMCSSLFQSMEFRINDKTVSRVSDNVPQVDALETRLHKSKGWFDSIGKSTNFWQSDFKERQADVAINGVNQLQSESRTSRLQLNYDPATTIAITAATGVLTFAGGANIPDATLVYKAGDFIEINLGGAIGTVKYNISGTPSATTLQLNNEVYIAVGAVAAPFNLVRRVDFQDEARKASEFELIWQPPLSIFKVNHALPSGKYELYLSPQTQATLQLACIESTGAPKIPNVDYVFSIVDLYMYVQTLEGPRADNITYLLDLNQTRCQADKIDAPTFGQKSWDVSPSTHALTVAYQDLRAGTNSLISVSKFKSYNVGINSAEELKLNRLFIQYAGSNLPQPDGDPNFSTDAAKNVDQTAQRYIESQINNGAFYDTGGAETITDYHDRGSYYYFTWPRDGTDRSTRVNVHQGFIGTADVVNMRVLLFDHSKQVARVRVQDGNVVDVQLIDA
jgi:hypothetical protein